MESEARNQINNDYDEFFYATMCHVCKRFSDDVLLKICSKCRMIAYCSKEHQRQHWKQHKPLCKAIQDVLCDFSMDRRGENTEEWVLKKVQFAQLVSAKLGRRLNTTEMDMFCFPRECLVCHERNIESLNICQKCAASFCKNHKNGTEHRDICATLKLCLCTDLFLMREGNKPLNLSFNLQYTCTSTFQNMNNFIKACRNIQTDSEMSCNVLAAIDSDYLTHSLTLFYAMQLLNNVPKCKDLVVHVLCTRRSDEIGWELFSSLIETVVPAVVVLIGLELPCKSNLSHDCDNCRSREKKCVMFEFHDTYENYACSPSFVKPDVVVGFNPRIGEHKFGFSEELWASSIKLIAKQNCPFILTCPTLRSFKKETDRINTILNKRIDLLYSGKNPFASLLPYRITREEYVSFLNQYIIIYRSLCS